MLAWTQIPFVRLVWMSSHENIDAVAKADTAARPTVSERRAEGRRSAPSVRTPAHAEAIRFLRWNPDIAKTLPHIPVATLTT